MKYRSNLLLGFQFIVSGCVALLAGCATTTAPTSEKESVAARDLRMARSKRAPEEERAGFYVQAAALTAPQLGAGTTTTAAREIYNWATAELTALLRTEDNGRLWNHPLTVTAGGSSYRLGFQPGRKGEYWSPDFFTALKPASQVSEKIISHPHHANGVGGALVGVRKKDPREEFAPFVGVTAPVTATLDFQGHNATLALRDPRAQAKARVEGVERPLAADFSAPLAYYPAPNEMIMGLMGAINVTHYMSQTGLYTLEPYDPDRIPIVFVHGLISTGRMWRNVINDLEADPVVRARYQCWAFNYPTGNPVLYSALRCRESLTAAEKRYGLPHGFVLVGHSMGGMVSRLQASTFDRAAWSRGAGASAEEVLAAAPEGSLIHRAMIFNANPKIRRIVFICTPHRGSNMAIQSIGQIAMRLIALPSNLVSAVKGVAGDALAKFSGSKGLPNSISSLSPKNPTLKVMDGVAIRAPHHTIFGDQGIHNEPNSTDGVVPYWSSHLDSALSEKSVPGPHGSCELPETIAEVQRILHLQLQSGGN
jgi:pimeloyl-ACP methyl ester carboxylesterase